MAGPRSVAEMAARLTRKPLGKRGFAEASLVAQWSSVVGTVMGQFTAPLKIAFPPGERSNGVLHIRVASGAMATQLQHLEPLILQRINAHFGYGAVARLHMVQGPLPPRQSHKAPPPPKLTPEQEQTLQSNLEAVEDPELRDALARLGRHLAARS